MIAHAVAELRRSANLPADPAKRGPVPLDRFFQELFVSHFALPALTLGRVSESLRADGVPVEALGDPELPLAGFLFVAGRIGRAFVNADEILPRRRFSAAHELGHFVLHRGKMFRFKFDTDKTLLEANDANDPMEREANQFAAELLMPEELLRARAEELKRESGACPRLVLAYRLSSELLVSREAMRYRLKNLGVGDDE
jgi:hypothetical protein